MMVVWNHNYILISIITDVISTSSKAAPLLEYVSDACFLKQAS